MKRKLAWTFGVIALIVTAFALQKFPLQESKTLVSAHHQQEVRALHPKSACQIFTAAAAKAILRGEVRSVDVPPVGQTSTEDMRISSCTYEAANIGLSLTVRAALHRSAYETNTIGFRSTRTAAIGQGLDIHTGISSRYHTAAYYNPMFKQLNVLLHHGQYWLIIQADTGKNTAEQLAQVSLNQLLQSR